MRRRYTETANHESEQLFASIAADNPAAAAKIAATIEATIARLSSFPRLGAETDVDAVRVIVARPYAYLIYYTVENDVLLIRNIRHPARRRTLDLS